MDDISDVVDNEIVINRIISDEAAHAEHQIGNGRIHLIVSALGIIGSIAGAVDFSYLITNAEVLAQDVTFMQQCLTGARFAADAAFMGFGLYSVHLAAEGIKRTRLYGRYREWVQQPERRRELIEGRQIPSLGAYLAEQVNEL